MAEKKNSFIVYTDNLEYLEELSDAQLGQLYRAQILYAKGEQPKIEDQLVRLAFKVIKGQMDRNAQKYEEKCKRIEKINEAKAQKNRDNIAKPEHEVDSKSLRNRDDIVGDNEPVPVPVPVPVNDNKELLSNDNNCQSETDTASEASVPEKKQKPVLTKADLQTVKDVWNEKAGGRGVPTLFAISETSTRYKMLKARIQEYGLSKVLEGIDRIAESDFLCHGNKNWKGATFDWFVKPNNFPKVIEGYYSDTRDRASPAVTDNPLDDPDIAGYLRRKHGIH